MESGKDIYESPNAILGCTKKAPIRVPFQYSMGNGFISKSSPMSALGTLLPDNPFELERSTMQEEN